MRGENQSFGGKEGHFVFLGLWSIEGLKIQEYHYMCK